jgi:hypothetical protein
MSTLDEYHESLEHSRQWCNGNHPGVRTAFQTLDDGYVLLADALREGRDGRGMAYIEGTLLLFVVQRQAFVALDALSSVQAYQAWLLVRPGVESALIIGKFFDDPANKDAWFGRREDAKEYRKRFGGGGLSSSSLPESARIQGALSAINDSFVHPNPFYVLRHIGFADRHDDSVAVSLQFFDHDQFHWASVLAILHLSITVLDSLARMFAKRFVNLEILAERFGLEDFRKQHIADVRQAMSEDSALGEILITIGLWDLAVDVL